MDNVGREPRLVEAVVALEARSPITRTVEGERAVFVAVLSAKKPSVESDYKSVAAKVREVYLNNKSTALAQEKARTFALEMSKAADPAKSLAALAKGAVVKTLPPFTQMEPPKENAQAVMALTAGTENGKLSRSLDLPDGVFMVFVVSRTEPDAAALLTGGTVTGPHRIEGIGDDFIPAVVDPTLINHVADINDLDAIAMAAKIGRVLGLGVGISSGANFLGAVLQNRQPGRQVATVFADDSKKYLTTLLATPPAETSGMVTSRIELLGYEPVETR